MTNTDELAETTRRSFNGVDKRLDKVDKRLSKVDARITKVEKSINEVRKDIADYKKETIRHFDVVAENIHQDVASANRDEISLIIQKQENLERRVHRIEQKVGV